jgi:hypothetical protein
MKTLSLFVVKFTSLIVAVLSCFDRVIFRHFSLNTTDGLSEIIRFGLESYGLRPCK